MFIFAFVCEITGALLLYPFLYQAGIDNPFWSAVFHSVSAFCTAGFSLNPTSFEAFKEGWGVNLILAFLSYAGGIGFIVFTDLVAKVKNPKRSLTFTTKVILTFTLAGTVLGTFCIYFLEPTIQGLSFSNRLLAAFFQTMTASTTVGFNTLPISQLALPTVLVLYFLMFFGASPAGTGGGLKSTTLTALIAEAWSHLRGYSQVCLMGRELPNNRVRAASMTATTYVLVLGLGLFFLSIAMPKANFELMVFEAISALGTVGLSMGLTPELNSTGKLIIIALMYIGRIGMVTFGLSFVSQKLLLKHEKTDLAV